MAQGFSARDAEVTMTHSRLPRERAPDADTARPGLAGWTLALWLVAAFLGGLVASHYLLARILAGDAAVDAAIPLGWQLF